MQANVTELLAEASTLMVVGMGVVFVFLSLMIGAINLIAYINNKFPEEVSQSNTASSRRTSAKVQSSIPVAAITAAVHQYRKDHK
jgi:oxaloacetate decarboxylase gamma subunit